MTTAQDRAGGWGWGEERDALVRAIAGGMLFGIPLLYTMEVWATGSLSEAPALLAALVAPAVPVFLLNRTSGFRSSKDVRTWEAAGDTVEALAVALLSSAAVLLLLREISTETAPLEAIGKVVYEAVPFAIGVSLARHYLQGAREDEEEEAAEEEEEEEEGERARLHQTAADAGAAAVGALIIAFNIAPTDEIPQLASPITGGWLLAIVLFSLTLTYTIVFAAGFRGTEQRHQHEGLLQSPLAETLLSYVVALLVSALLLLFFQRIDPQTPTAEWVEQVIVLGLPASVGAAAGRLAV